MPLLLQNTLYLLLLRRRLKCYSTPYPPPFLSSHPKFSLHIGEKSRGQPFSSTSIASGGKKFTFPAQPSPPTSATGHHTLDAIFIPRQHSLGTTCPRLHSLNHNCPYPCPHCRPTMRRRAPYLHSHAATKTPHTTPAPSSSSRGTTILQCPRDYHLPPLLVARPTPSPCHVASVACCVHLGFPHTECPGNCLNQQGEFGHGLCFVSANNLNSRLDLWVFEYLKYC